MSRLNLEDFSTPEPEKPASSGKTAAADAQEVRLHAYEEGYKAGWDDASTAETESRSRITADFAKTLQEMSFSYHEARAHVLGALGPLLTAMVERVVPHIAQAGFARTVVETAMQMAETEADRPVRLRINPDNREAFEMLIGDAPGLPLALVVDDTIGPGQALISGADSECEVDIDGMLSVIKSALDDFMTQDEEDRRHG